METGCTITWTACHVDTNTLQNTCKVNYTKNKEQAGIAFDQLVSAYTAMHTNVDMPVQTI